MTDAWDPERYQQFETERNEPFFDLLRMIRPSPHMRIIDLGCGTGKLTRFMHHALHADETLGIDISQEMLRLTESIEEPNLHFKLMDVLDFANSNSEDKYDLIISNACLQWIPHHDELLEKLMNHLNNNGQLAIQIPSNFDYPTHSIAKELAAHPPFNHYLEGHHEPAVLKPEQYAEILYKLGFRNQIVRLQVYGHELKSAENAIEWIQGSLLTYYRSHLPKEIYQEFFNLYKEKILARFGRTSPFFMPFKRILLHAQK